MSRKERIFLVRQIGLIAFSTGIKGLGGAMATVMRFMLSRVAAKWRLVLSLSMRRVIRGI